MVDPGAGAELPPLQLAKSETSLTTLSAYDVNFAYPLTLQSDRIKLGPFIPSVHAETYWRHVGDRRTEIFHYYPAIFTLEETISFFELFLRRNPHNILFAVPEKMRPDA
ncbi:hypothetical protein K466DRAFT_600190 [Polyporus arcularius HHB13444]|uniref:Uncharacterized protein n=1 Tax=Polyporus arcularius HHB13444 TaxID=1314778 RepID=A0A5C3PBI6_9APHY|nr:hypothetical protein K466DRAFT_600190 [Polyporus arcularius HHB13444]